MLGYGSASDLTNYNCSFRPALEITSDPSAVKTITFDMGGNGYLGPGTMTSATVVYTGSITLPDFTADDGFTFLGSGWGKLRWSDGTNFYEPGKSYDLPAGTVLKAGYEPVAEQFNLQPGGIYYFDLSGEDIPGTVNQKPVGGELYPPYNFWPDTTLKWVPFIYAGTVNAYSLDASSAGDPSASTAAAASDRSLFVSTSDWFSNVSWNELNAEGLIFGRSYESGGVSYSLRSMSMGNGGNGAKWGAQRGLPANNEWDQLMDKDAVYQFKSWNLAYWIGRYWIMGQDSALADNSRRAARWPGEYEYIRDVASSSGDASGSTYFRPILEIKSPSGTELRTITFDLGTSGTLGENSTPPSPVVDTSPITSATVVYTGSITLPEITAANGFNYTGSGTGTLGWYDGTTFYAPGTTVTLDTSKTLTAGYGTAAPAVDAGNSSVSDETTPVSPAANSAFTFTVSVRDAAGEPVSGLNQAAFAITENGAGSLTVDSVTEDGATGNYTVTARHDTAETITITAAVSGVTITDTLGNVVIQAAADPSDFSVQLETAGDKTAGQPFNLSITGAKGTDGSALSGNINVAVTSDRDGEVHNAAVTFTAGAAAVPVTLTTAGGHTLTVTVTGVTNPETAAATVAPAGVNAGKSTVSAGTTPASPVKNSGFTFTVTVSDAYDNPISGLAAGDFDITGNGTGSLTVDSVAEDGATGNYTVTARHDTAETVAITVEVSSVEIGSIAGVVIQDAAADQSDFHVQLETAGDKTAGQSFNLSITNAKAVSGSALSGSINVTVTSSVYGEVHNAPITFTAGSATVPVTLTTVDDYVLTVTVTGVTNPETVNVTVVAAVTTGGISGTVLYDDGGGGSPLEGATVTVNAGGTDYTATTAADGAYTISNVPAGSGYTVTASKTGYTDGTVNNVSVTAGSTTANVNFLLATPVNGVIAGVAKDSGNNPISGVTVSLSVSGTVYQATTDTNGTYTISGVPAGSGYTVTASKAGYHSGTVNNVTVAAGSTATVDFTLTPVSGDAAVSIAAIPGVTAPVRGATPVTVITETAQYTGTVTWSPNNTTFAGGTVYTATITLTPKAGYTLTGVSANFFTVAGATSVSNAAGSGVVTAVFPATSSGGGGGGGGSAPVTPTYKATVSGTNISETSLPVSVNTNTGSATADLGTILAKDIFAGSGTAVLTVPSIPGVNSFTLGIPADSLSGSQGEGALTFSAGAGSITIPSGMLAGVAGTEGKNTGITIGQGDKSSLPDEVKTVIGDRPIVQLILTIDGTQTEWNNPDVPVTISIPYTPTAAELANPESIVIWYIDGSGNAVTIPNGHYDEATGMVTFDTTHFSCYAVAYNRVSFSDVSPSDWFSKAVGFIAARKITTGTGNGNYSPDAKLTRGEFIVMLLKAYDIVPDNAKDNFTDAGNTYYTGYLASAKRLGISEGIGNNMFAPGKEITRQEMFTLLYNALKVIGCLPEGTDGKDLTAFSDAGDVASWARDAMTLFVKTGTVGGNGGKLSPTATTTRAEMAQVLYNLLGK